MKYFVLFHKNIFTKCRFGGQYFIAYFLFSLRMLQLVFTGYLSRKTQESNCEFSIIISYYLGFMTRQACKIQNIYFMLGNIGNSP